MAQSQSGFSGLSSMINQYQRLANQQMQGLQGQAVARGMYSYSSGPSISIAGRNETRNERLRRQADELNTHYEIEQRNYEAVNGTYSVGF